MKLSKYILGSLVMVAGLLTSCNQDNIGGVYTPTGQNVSFEVEEPAQILASSSSVDNIAIRVIRSLSEGSYTAHYTISGNEDGIFVDKNGGQITFEDGQTVAVVNLSAQNMEGGEEYEISLNLSDADVATADKVLDNANAKTVISVKCDYVWGEKAMGYEQSQFFGQEWDQPIQKAQGFNVYKVLSPFADGLDYVVKINSDNTVEVKMQHVWNHSSYGKIYVVGDYDEKGSGFAGYYYPEQKAIVMYLYWCLADGRGFGTYQEVLFLP